MSENYPGLGQAVKLLHARSGLLPGDTLHVVAITFLLIQYRYLSVFNPFARATTEAPSPIIA